MGQEKPEGGSNGNNDGNEKKEKKSGISLGKLWLPVVLFIGAVIGIISYELTIQMSRVPPFGRPFVDVYLALHIILSTIGMALLVALIVVYARTYLQTKANFILGLLVVLFALLLQSLLTYPVLLEIEVAPRPAIEVFSPVADVFTIIAYMVFLYLSLE